MISEGQLQQMMPTLNAAKRETYLPFLGAAMETYEINSPLRAAAFLAQLAHESGELRFMEEIWGPTAQQRRYEPPSDLAARLGNTQRGDGARFKGRGPIQITGRFNYRKYGNLLGVDLVEMPELAATPQIAFAIAGLFWQANGLNELADVQDFTKITKRINGGLNGLPSREKYYARALQVFDTGEDFTRSSRSVPSTSPRSAPDIPPAADNNTLPRGQEAIEEVLGTSAAITPKRSAKKAATKKPATKKSATKKPAAKKTAQKARKKSAKRATEAAAKKRTTPAKTAAKKTAKKAAKKAPRKTATAKRPAQKAARKK